MLAAGGALAVQQAALAQVESHLPRGRDVDAIPASDRIDAMVQAMEALSGQVKELQRDSRKPALLKAEFLVAQLVTIFVLLCSFATQEADSKTQDFRWDQLEIVLDQILVLERQQAQALAKDTRTQYVVKARPIPLRSSFKAKAPVVTLLYPNTRVHLMTSRGPWVKVELFDLTRGEYRYGWCLKKYLQRLESPAAR